ncbi:MAG TPA: hypothetical protein GX702_00020 [Chloroflexi bacterium]|jgi:hypothetical protein|nr:hypothetical protein [Chloroflexota bacterium]
MLNNRMVRALCAEEAVYHEVAMDASATGQALAIIGLAVLLNAVATTLSLGVAHVDGRSAAVALTWVLSWLVGSLAIYLPIARAEGGNEHLVATLRVMAFAILPTVVGLLVVGLFVALALLIPSWVLVAVPTLLFVLGWALKAAITGVNEVFNLGLGRALMMAVVCGMGVALFSCLALMVWF